jgi:hypothetical protein
VSVPTVLVVVFAGVALGLSAASLAFSLSARSTAREAHGAVRQLAAAAGRRKRPAPEPEPEHVERREQDAGPAEGQPERRRHRAPEGAPRYSRLRASADAREAGQQPVDDATTQLPAVRPEEDLATAEHPAPTSTYRRPPPPLPPPGAIGRSR